MKDLKRSTDMIQSKDEWEQLTAPQIRAVFGECPKKGNYITFLSSYFGPKKTVSTHPYDLYTEWWTIENTPLGQELK